MENEEKGCKPRTRLWMRRCYRRAGQRRTPRSHIQSTRFTYQVLQPAMADKKQRLVLSILDFLSESMNDGTVKEEDKEGVEVAAQSIGEAFGVDPSNEQQRERLSIKPANLHEDWH
ncbi:hypothetical protein JB92DRAFT_934566 [Gautieria morchelliformis]|nr:hypothetical protein JB92DRAFT_934566 [Gautieria morchelliformis]